MDDTKITSVHIRMTGTAALRPGDPVPITVHLPIGVYDVDGWCERVEFDRDRTFGGANFTASVVFYDPRKREETELLVDESF